MVYETSPVDHILSRDTLDSMKPFWRRPIPGTPSLRIPETVKHLLLVCLSGGWLALLVSPLFQRGFTILPSSPVTLQETGDRLSWVGLTLCCAVMLYVNMWLLLTRGRKKFGWRQFTIFFILAPGAVMAIVGEIMKLAG